MDLVVFRDEFDRIEAGGAAKEPQVLINIQFLHVSYCFLDINLSLALRLPGSGLRKSLDETTIDSIRSLLLFRPLAGVEQPIQIQ